MLVVLISKRAILVFLSICLMKSASQAITQLASFNNMKTGSDSGFELDLYSMVSGPNLTFSIKGTYSPVLPTSKISIMQNLNLSTKIAKKSPSMQYQKYGGLQLDKSRNLLYTLDSNTINCWSTLDLPNLTLTSSYAISTTDTVISVEIPSSSYTDEYKSGYYLSTVEKSPTNTYTIRIINATDYKNLAEIPSLSILRYEPNYIRASFSIFENVISGFFYSTDLIDVFIFNLTGNSYSDYITQINNTNLAVDAIAPVSLVIYMNTGIYCDAALGIFQFSLANMNEIEPYFPILLEISQPAVVGNLTSCTIFYSDDFFESYSDILTVDTLGGTALYSLPNFDLLTIYPFNATYNVKSVYGMTSNEVYTVGYTTTQIKDALYNSLRVYSQGVSYLNSLLIDLPLNTILQDDLSNPNPAFGVLQDLKYDSYIIINAGNNLLVYYIENGSHLSFPSQSVPYNYTGNLTVTNGLVSMNIPVYVNGISANSTQIYNFKGIYPEEGYAAYTNYASYILTSKSNKLYFYMPLSNYFVGYNVTYNLTLTQGFQNYDTIDVTVPAKSLFQSSNNVSSTLTGQPTVFVYGNIMLSDSGVSVNDVVAVLEGNTVYLNVYQNYNLSRSFNFTAQNPQLSPVNFFVYPDDEYNRLEELFLIVESSGVDNNETLVQWSVYMINGSSAVLVNNMNFTNSSASEKIQVVGNYLYSLWGNVITVYEITSNNSTFAATYYTNISNATLDPAISFNPLSFVADLESVYIYDAKNGLMSATITNSTNVSYRIANLSFFSANETEMNLNDEYISLYLNNQNRSAIYKIPYEMDSYVLLPSIDCNTTLSVSLSNSFAGLLCNQSNEYYIQVLDLYSESYASLYTVVGTPNPGVFGLGYDFSYGNVGLYFTDGLTIQSYSIGQVGDSDWAPYFPVSIYPDYEDPNVDSLSQITWGRVSLEFKDSIYRPSYALGFLLTGSNNYMSLNTSIQYTLYNTAAYIDVNTNYNPASSSFTYGTITVSTNFSEALPLQAFYGNDIDFAFQLNGTLGNVVPAVEVCSNLTSNFCLENKTWEFNQVPGSYFDFDAINDTIITVNGTNFTIYNLTTNEIIDQFNGTVFPLGYQCYNVRILPSISAYLFSCKSESNYGLRYYLNLVNYGQNNSHQHMISYKTVWMDVYEDVNGDNWIHHYEGTTLSIIRAFQYGDEHNSNLHLSVIAEFNQNSFLISSFKPLGISYLNSSMFVIGETSLGLIFVNIKQVDTTYTFSLNRTYMPVTNVLDLADSKVSSFRILSDLDTAFLVMSTADVYKISVLSLTVLTHYPKIISDSFVPGNIALGVDEANTFISFPVYNKIVGGVIRIINYSTDMYSAIYKDRLLNNSYDPNYSKVLLINGNADNSTLLHNLSPSNNMSSDRPVHVILVRKKPMGYLYGSQNEPNGTIALVGYSKGNEVQFAPVNYFYPGQPVPVPVPIPDIVFGSDWNTWYFWVLLGLGVLLIVTGLSAIVVAIKSKTERSYSMELGLSTPNS